MVVSATAKTFVPEPVPQPTAAEREVADLLSIRADHDAAQRVLAEVPLWFHTFSLDGGAIYTPGVARDHRYRVPFLPEDLTGNSVVDVGTFDGFYAFLAEARGAERVVAVDNEQYRDWVHARFGVELEGGEGFRAIAELLRSRVEYQRLDALRLAELEEEFELALCFGILHRVESPLALLRALRAVLAPGGSALIETYGVSDPALAGDPAIRVLDPGEVYARDDFVFWGFTGESLDRLARHAGFAAATTLSMAKVAGHPRLMASLETAA
jgi:tRNA (mo5U34)-methyltransferase